MTKPKLFIWGDSPTVSTGFGIVARNLCEYFKDHFEIGILGINDKSLSKYDTSKYFIYSIDTNDPLGINKFPIVLEDFKPDVVLLFQDIWNTFILSTKYENLLSKYPLVYYFPVDGRPFSKAWKETLLKADEIVTYTKWGKSIIYENIPELRERELYNLAHGIDTSVFYPMEEKEIVEVRKEFKWENKFVAININRFQPRKHVNQTLRIMSFLRFGYNRCKCGNLYSKFLTSCDLNGCSTKDVVSTTEPNPKMALYLHMNVTEPTMGTLPTDYLTTHALNYGYNKSHLHNTLFINDKEIYSKEELTHKDLNKIYNAANILISTGLGEGFGFSTAEALATGTPVIVGKHSANFEVVGDTCPLIDNIALINWGRDNGHIRPVMDVGKAVQQITEYFEEYKKAGYKKIVKPALVEHVRTNFNWKNIADNFVIVIKNALEKRKSRD